MSQIIKPLTSSGPIPPIIPTDFHTQNGDAIPDLNILNIFGTDTNTNNDEGLQTTAALSPTNTVTVQLTNRNRATLTTTNATLTTLLTESLNGAPGTYYVSGIIAAYNSTDAIGAAYSFTAAAFTNGTTTATVIGTSLKDIFEASGMSTCDIVFTVSGNNALVSVQGVVGKTIDWKILSTYMYVG